MVQRVQGEVQYQLSVPNRDSEKAFLKETKERITVVSKGEF